MTILVRNGSRQVGIDWRAVAALGGLCITLATITIGMLQERVAVLAHVAKGEAMMQPVQRHIDNIAPDYKHLDPEQARLVAALPWQMMRIREDLGAIKRKLRINNDDIRIEAHIVPPGEDDEP